MATFIDFQLSTFKFRDAVLNRLRAQTILSAATFDFQGIPPDPTFPATKAILDHVEFPKGSVVTVQPGLMPGQQSFHLNYAQPESDACRIRRGSIGF
jgi:hypothetical protein